MPPPPTAPTPLRTRSARVVAATLIASTPISGFIAYALLATVLGEERLEQESGLTSLGWLAIAIPAIMGLAVLLWSFSTVPLPSRTAIAAALAIAAVACALAGAWSVNQASSSNDASIGGGLLVLAAGPLLAAAVVLWIRRRG